MEPATALLVRHGETRWNRDGRIQGWAPTGLTEQGRDQAREVARRLGGEDVDRVVASDLCRTRETARILGRSLGLDGESVGFDPGWRERSFGVYQGLTYDELFGGYPEFDVGTSGVAAVEATPQDGESLLAMRRRVLDAWETLRGEVDPGETVVVVTHGGPIHVLRAHLLDRDIVTEIDEYGLENCSVQEVRIQDGEAVDVEVDCTRRDGQTSRGGGR